ncbi:MAG: hypothetical protein ACK2TU_00260, partial [Anaerolineales bacterium]
MTSKQALYVIIFFSLFIFYSCSNKDMHSLISGWDDSSEGVFLGKELWGNRLQDWQAKNGRLECINGQYPLRTVHVLTHEINNMDASFRIDVKVGLIHNQTIEEEACAGLLIGAGSLDIDYRGRSLIFGRPGENGGLIAGINGKGELTILDIGKNLEVIAKSEPVPGLLESLMEGCQLSFSVKPADGNFTGSLTESKTGTSITFPVSKERITGNVGIVAHLGYHTGDGSFWFKDLQLSGPKLSYNPERTLGPIVSTLHTLSRNILNMSVQLMPVGPNEPDKILLTYKEQNAENWE